MRDQSPNYVSVNECDDYSAQQDMSIPYIVITIPENELSGKESSSKESLPVLEKKPSHIALPRESKKTFE